MPFRDFFESRQFARLIPAETLSLIPEIKRQCVQFSKDYFADKNSVQPFVTFKSLPDPFYTGDFDICFVRSDEWKRLGLPPAQGLAWPRPDPARGKRFLMYRIPMTDLATVYHEIVHMYDPKLAKGLSSENVPWAQKPSEVDAGMAGAIDIMRDKVKSASPSERKRLLDELFSWLRKVKSEEDLENPPELLRMPLWHLQGPNWRKLLSSVYNAAVQLRAPAANQANNKTIAKH